MRDDPSVRVDLEQTYRIFKVTQAPEPGISAALDFNMPRRKSCGERPAGKVLRHGGNLLIAESQGSTALVSS